MQLKTFRHLWGVNQPVEQVLPLIKEAGYDGVEWKSVRAAHEPQFKQLLNNYELRFIAQIHTIGNTVEEHLASFKQLIQLALPLNPVLINSQSGSDSWRLEEKLAFIDGALQIEQELGIAIAHETHRGRITYNPWDTYSFLQAFSKLKLCCDFSHWVCVCERLIDSEIHIIRACAEKCIHLHSRVGYEQGPQVSDPRAPEYREHLLAHENWWDIIWQAQAVKGNEVSTLTPEFGPPEYQHTLPYSQVPVADVWEVCNWMNNRQKERFKQHFNIEQHVTIN